MKIADVCIRRPVFASVLIGTMVVFGLVAYRDIGVDLFPDVEFPVVTVTAVYPGADPETIESKVIEPLEEAVGSVAGIDFMQATAQDNVGVMIVQFVLERDGDEAAQDVREKVAAAQPNLPADMEPPVVQKFDIGAAPILQLALGGELSPRELTRLADDVVKARLQTVAGVGSVELIGKREREIHAWLDPEALEQYGLTSSDVVGALGAQNVDIPGGRLEPPGRELSLKTRGQVSSAAELGEIVITAAAGTPIRVRDVARVEDGEEEARSAAYLDGQSAIGLVVRKQSGANTVEVARRVREALEELKPDLPETVAVTVALDNSSFIEASIESVRFDLAFGGLLAVLIILFFLGDWRATVISALALPSSVIAAFAVIEALGFTFNQMTMLALTLSIGILIDDAIVVIENIYRHLELGKSPVDAARDGTAEIGLAVMATTAAIVAVFLPVAVMKGMIGQFFLQFGVTVAAAVILSLIVAFTITPAYAARLLRPDHGPRSWIGRLMTAFLDGIDSAYRVLLGLALRHPFVTLAAATGIFVGSFALLAYVPTEFIPAEDRGEFTVRVELPQGTDLATTESYSGEIAEQLRAVPGVVHTWTTVGAGAQGEVNLALIQVNTLPKQERAFSQAQAMEHVRAKLAGRDDAIISVEQVDAFGGGGAFKQTVIQFNIRGHVLDELREASTALTGALAEAGGFVDLDTSFRGGKPEVQVTIDRDRAADLGVPIAALAMTLRTFFAGEKATELVTPDGRYDVRARLAAEHRQDPAVIPGLTVRSTKSGQLIPLSELVMVTPGSGAGKITRQDRQRQITVFANLEGRPMGAAMAEVERLAGEVVPPSLSTAWTGTGDIMIESFGYMGEALILAIILVYLILAAQFESLIHPLTIMFSLPLAVTGAFGALALSGMSLNIFTFIGFIMLMGIVTKNAILLVDYTNQLRERGVERREALLQAGPTRLRPILMTTLATVFGMVPVAISQEAGAEQRAPMAIAVIGGLLSSTFLTLVVVPVVYEFLDRLAGLFRRRKPAATPQPAEPASA